MSYPASVNTSTIQQWMANKLSPQAVEEEMIAKGMDVETIASYLQAFRRVRNSQRLFTGFICLGIGAFLGFLSCVLTLINVMPQFYNIILYGLTSLAILIILVGLYYVFE